MSSPIPPKRPPEPAVPVAPTASVKASAKISMPIRLTSLKATLFTDVVHTLSKPFIIAASLGAAAIILLAARRQPASRAALSLQQVIDICTTKVDEGLYEEAKEDVEGYTAQFLAQHPTSPPWTQSAYDCLVKKFSHIFIDMELPTEEKLAIINTIQADFLAMHTEIVTRVVSDVLEGRLISLGVDPSCALQTITFCGSETHNHGKIPVKLTFSNGVEIIYKPRSMQPELLMYGREDSVFTSAGLGSYGVVCSVDERGHYGYCECLSNHEAANTMRSVEEVQHYVNRFSTIERIAKELGLSDLHCENFITSDKIPLCIDGEVYLAPPGTMTGIFEQFGAANTFDPYNGCIPNTPTNRIWFHPLLTEGKEVSFRYAMRQSHLEAIGVHIQDPKAVDLPAATQASIRACRASLQERPGRYVLIETLDLKRMLKRMFPSRDNTTVLEFIKESLEEKSFEFESGSEEAILRGLAEDALHHDVPIFYYDSRNRTILYHDTIIGRLQH